MPLLEVRDLTHIYSVGTPFEHIALSHVDLRVERGEFLGLIGHTGSGKSTLIQHLNGLLRPTSGQVLLDGRDLFSDKRTTRAARFRVGLVFQYPEYQLFEETVYKDIAFGPTNLGLKGEELKERVLQAADAVGLEPDLLDRSPFDLSGGQKRRVAIAGVVAMHPEVLILDEPTAGLDPRGRQELLAHICRLRADTGTTVIMVSHSMEEIAATVDRLVVLSRGTVAMDDRPEVVFSRGEELRAMGLDLPQVTQVFQRLRALGLEVPDNVFTIPQAAAALSGLQKEAEEC